MFSIFPILFGIVFVIIFGVILATVIKGISTWNKNNHQPRLNTQAEVVAKRKDIHGGGETNAHYYYYVTFEFESGDRLELKVPDKEFGQLVEGDIGELQFQGTRYLGFTRTSLMK